MLIPCEGRTRPFNWPKHGPSAYLVMNENDWSGSECPDTPTSRTHCLVLTDPKKDALKCRRVPVIYAGKGEGAELLDSQECGLAVGPEDPARLGEAIEKIVVDSTLRDRLGQTGRKLVETEYSRASIVRQWIDETGYDVG